jgi:hypothetical protein
VAGNQPARKDAGAFDFNSWLARGAQFLDAEARRVGGDQARRLGNRAGVVRWGVHALQGTHNDMALAGRILNPMDRVFSPQKPLQPMINGVDHIVDYAFNAPAHPGSVAADAGKQLQQWNVELNPYATPQARTLGGELIRNAQIGANQGEAAMNFAPLGYGLGAMKALRGLVTLSEAAGAAKFAGQGFSPAEAARLAEPYDGMGHHFFPRSGLPPSVEGVSMPDSLVGWQLPTWLSDSAFNVLKPNNMHKGDFYELHYRVDPDFKGTKIFRGRPGWSGAALGLKDKQYGLLGRLWHGSPAPLNAAVGVTGAVELARHDDDGDGQ